MVKIARLAACILSILPAVLGGAAERERSVTMFLALTGRPTVEEVERKLDVLKAGGVDSFMVYPTSGMKLEYLGREFFDVVRAFADGAKRRGMKVWLYDEFNWPSGTCKGRVPAESDDYKLAHLTCARQGGGFAWSRQFARAADVGMISGDGKRGWSNLLEPRAVDRFIALTHDAYARELTPFFADGTVRGIFTDEPFHMAPVDLPKATVASVRWYDGLESDYATLSGGGNLRADVEAWAAASNRASHAEVWNRYNTLYARRFRSAYFDRITAWTDARNILSTGHMIIEDNPVESVRFNGDPLQTLAGLSFPGMDEISTKTTPDRMEWLTLHTVQYAIRKNGKGGMAELFACGPADRTPAECLKMIRICALHGVTRYFTVMSAMDASWMDEMHGFTTTIGDQQPWFAEFPLFLDAADEAAKWAAKRAVFDVAVRFPRRQLALAGMKSAKVPPLNALIRALECAQVGVELIREEDATSAPVVFAFDGETIREERTGHTFVTPDKARDWAVGHVPERFVLREADGVRAKDVLVRNYADGTHAFVRLGNEPPPVKRGKPVAIGGEWDLALTALPTLRLPFDATGAWRLTLECPMDGLRIAVRNGTRLLVDGHTVPTDEPCDLLRPSFNELYVKSCAFTLSAGVHEFRLEERQLDSNWYLPVAFLAGEFAERAGRLSPRLRTVAAGSLASLGLAGYCGTATWRKTVEVPYGDHVRLSLDTGGHFARVKIGGRDLGAVGWGDFSWEVPVDLRGQKAELEITVYTSLLPLFGSPEPPRGMTYRGARRARPCGILSPPEWRVE